MEKIAWFFQTQAGVLVVDHLWFTVLVGLLLYQSNYLLVFARLVLAHGWPSKPVRLEDCPSALLVLPTLLTRDAELAGLERAIASVLANGYPGPLTVCAAIDHADGSPALVHRLTRWVDELQLPENVEVVVATSAARVGKAMAIEEALRSLRARGPLPTVLFSMDADSEVTHGSLERLSATLLTPGRFTGARPLIVPANLGVRTAHYWKGWRHAFTVGGQISLQVAREFTVTCSLNRHNSLRLLPVVGVSGALYATWTELYTQAPRYGAFMKSIRVSDWLRWWLGAAPPSYSAFHRECPEASIGPGDDTWIAWLAISARWKRGRIDLELPRTPWHALVHAVRAYFVRAVVFAPEARVYTSTPTTVRGLFQQRVRWNSSRVWLIGRFGGSLLFKWQLGAIVFLDVALVLVFGGALLLFAVLLPFARQDTHWISYAIVAAMASFVVRSAATLLGMLQEGELPARWHKLLALPLSGLYALVFNVAPTILGYLKDLCGFGLNTGFAPEETLARAGTGRVALAYRLRRAFLLAVRAASHGDVPPGWFWLGWQKTAYTPGGYDGWTNPANVAPPVLPQPRRKRTASTPHSLATSTIQRPAPSESFSHE